MCTAAILGLCCSFDGAPVHWTANARKLVKTVRDVLPRSATWTQRTLVLTIVRRGNRSALELSCNRHSSSLGTDIEFQTCENSRCQRMDDSRSASDPGVTTTSSDEMHSSPPRMSLSVSVTVKLTEPPPGSPLRKSASACPIRRSQLSSHLEGNWESRLVSQTLLTSDHVYTERKRYRISRTQRFRVPTRAVTDCRYHVTWNPNPLQ